MYFFPFWDRCNNMEFSGPRWAEYEAHLYVTRPTASFHFAIASPSLRRSHFLTHPSPPLRRRRLVAVDAAARHRTAASLPPSPLRALPATAPPPSPAPRATGCKRERARRGGPSSGRRRALSLARRAVGRVTCSLGGGSPPSRILSGGCRHASLSCARFP